MDFNALYEELNSLTNAESMDFDECERYDDLTALANEVGELNLRDATFIADDDFREYAMEMEIVENVDFGTWPYTCIDWDWAANELKHDYTLVEWEGYAYYYLPEH